MNENDNTKQAAPDETAVSDHLAALREIQPPPDMRAHNLARIQQALDTSHSSSNIAPSLTRHDHQTLWRRRISIPLPFAAAFLLAFAGLAVLQVTRSEETASQFAAARPSPSTDAIAISAIAPSPPQQPATVAPATHSDPAGCTPVLQHEAIVIAGLGTIQTKDIYICESETP